jgi:cation diffusion facilitator CzcD-associated flavoprotein CzcO
MSAIHDVAVIGAGPYGLSTAAHLRGCGLQVAVFGKPLEMWREHMPRGMRLRSHWWATNLSAPDGEHAFDRFFGESGRDRSYPLPIDTFIEYGLWFQRRAVPDVDETYMSSLARCDGGFLLTLADGREVATRSVVMAIGLRYYAHRPPLYDGVPADLVSHASDHRDFSAFAGRDVVVIGGGQSAIESAALLHEAGARVQVVARRPIVWLPPDRADARGLVARLAAPKASIAPGWNNWVLDRLPFLFYRFPQAWKDRYNSNYHSGATDWLRERVLGKVILREGRTVTRVRAANGGVEATVSDGAIVRADHVVLGTGYRPDLERLTMIHPSLRAEIRAERGVPLLDHWFESSVPGLYFVGFTAVRAFGPLYRFVAGCGAAARRVAQAVARRRAAPAGAGDRVRDAMAAA